LTQKLSKFKEALKRIPPSLLFAIRETL